MLVPVRALAMVSLLAMLSLWHFRTTGHLSAVVLGTLGLFVFAWLAYGKAFTLATASLVKNQAGLAFQVLSGFFLVNSLLFVLTLATPFGMKVNVGIVLLGAVGLTIFAWKRPAPPADPQVELPSLLCIVVSGLAATLWCSDVQPLLVEQGSIAIFQTWQDTFFHVSHIRGFAQAHGLDTLQSLRMAGEPLPLYHYASYISPAAVVAVAEVPALDVYGSFQLPLGIFLVGLAACSLIASIWGGWPGLAAAAAVGLLPDAYQQGFGNRLLSYNFLSQVNLTVFYGIGCACMAWIFVLEGSRRGKPWTILVGYVFLGVCLLYKAQIFVANAFLILIFPWLFFAGLRLRWRLLVMALLTVLFVMVIAASQNMARVPLIRLDGSGLYGYLEMLLHSLDPGAFRNFFVQVFTQEQHSRLVIWLYAAAMILLSSFGWWLVATPLALAAGKAKTTRAVFYWPIFLVANYMVMAMGLALDTHGVAMPEELLNRPVVWVYFAVVIWTVGGGYYFALGNQAPRGGLGRASLAGLLCLGLISPMVFGQRLQTFPAWNGYANYKDFNSDSVCLVKASRYIKSNSRPGDIVQDSAYDPHYRVSALTERQMFAAAQDPSRLPKGPLLYRLYELEHFKALRDVNAILAFAAMNNIAWYLLQPDTPVAWPDAFLQRAAYQCEGYRVYRFDQEF